MIITGDYKVTVNKMKSKNYIKSIYNGGFITSHKGIVAKPLPTFLGCDITPIEDKIKLGGTIRASRLSYGLSYYSMHKLTGIQPKQQQAIEEGSSSYTIDSLLKVLDVLGFELNVARK